MNVAAQEILTNILDYESR